MGCDRRRDACSGVWIFAKAIPTADKKKRLAITIKGSKSQCTVAVKKHRDKTNEDAQPLKIGEIFPH